MPVKMSDKESVLEAELVVRVRAAGGVAEKTTVIGARGFFDRLVVLPGGRIIFCEVKRPKGGKMSPHQILRAEHYRALGAEVALLASSKDIDELLAKSSDRGDIRRSSQPTP